MTTVVGGRRSPTLRRSVANNTRSFLRPCGDVGLAGVLRFRSGVDCWIQVVPGDDLRVVRVAGSLRDEHVPDLLAACVHSSGRLRVDLTEVLSVDAIGVDALRRVRDAGAQLVGVPMYIQLKLDSLTPGRRGSG